MSIYDNNGRCHECDGTNGSHYPGCDFDGTNEYDSYGFHSRKKYSDSTAGKIWALFILALIIGYGINELIGVIIIIGIIFWMLVS